MKWPRVVVILCLCVLSGCPRSGQQPLSAEEPAWLGDAAQQGEVVVPIGERQLFLDDYVIAELNNLSRTMHQPDKKGAVIRPLSSDDGMVLTLSSPMWIPEENIYRIWAFTPPGYAESKDGLAWTRTVLPASDIRIHNVIYDPYDPDPSRRFKGSTFNSKGWHPIVSDSVTWQRLDVPPVPAGDTNLLYFDEKERLFIATVKKDGPYGRAVALSTSRDFEHWTKPELIFHADELDQQLGRKYIKARLADPTLQQPLYNDPASYNVDVYDMAVFRYEGLYIGLPLMYHATGPIANYPNTTGFHLIELVCSRDLHNWQRLGERKPFIGPSRLDSGAYDLTQLGPTAPILRLGPDSFSGQDELWFYYNGAKYRGGWTYVGTYPHGEHVPIPGLDPDVGAICLAVLRRDGFVSLDAGEEAGVLVTKPLVVLGRRLYVNIDAPEGSVQVEVLDEQGNSLGACEPLSGDEVEGQIKWPYGDLTNLEGRRVCLRFTLRQCSFYSFWFE